MEPRTRFYFFFGTLDKLKRIAYNVNATIRNLVFSRELTDIIKVGLYLLSCLQKTVGSLCERVVADL